MKNILTFTALLLVNCHLLISQQTFRADRDTVAEEQIKQLEFFLTDLISQRDIDTYASYLTDDYVRVAANGIVSTKDQVLQGFRNSTGTPGKMTPHDLNVRVYGTTAILRGILDIENSDGTKRTSVITKVFIHRDGKWYMAALQGTALPQ